jgi:hypothetical protein
MIEQQVLDPLGTTDPTTSVRTYNEKDYTLDVDETKLEDEIISNPPSNFTVMLFEQLGLLSIETVNITATSGSGTFAGQENAVVDA